MTKNKLFLAAVLMIAAPAFARPRSVQMLTNDQFDAVSAVKINADDLDYSYGFLSFADWVKRSPLEYQDLALYPGYREHMVVNKIYGVEKSSLETLMIYSAKMKLILNKSPAQLHITELIKLSTIRNMDLAVEHREIQANELMSTVVAQGPINNFKWGRCAGKILRPAREKDLSFINPPNRAWCADHSHSLCLESCYLFNGAWTQSVNAINLAYSDEDRKKDPGIGTQSEVRYFASEAELGLPVELKRLTKLDTRVRGGLEQNIFYVNQLFEFGKVVSVLQDHPTDPSKTVMTTFFIMAIKLNTFEKYRKLGLESVLAGTSRIFNSSSGITAGLPVFSQNMIESIADFLEK